MAASTLRRIFGRSFAIGPWNLGNRDHPAVAPRSLRKGDDGFGQVSRTQLKLLAPCGFRPEHRSLAHFARIGVGQHDPQIDCLGPY